MIINVVVSFMGVEDFHSTIFGVGGPLGLSEQRPTIHNGVRKAKREEGCLTCYSGIFMSLSVFNTSLFH